MLSRPARHAERRAKHLLHGRRRPVSATSASMAV